MSSYDWQNPVRTGSDGDGASVEARTHVPDPAAVERLKQLLGVGKDAVPAGRRAKLALLHRRLRERNQRRIAAGRRVFVDDEERVDYDSLDG